MALGEPLVGLPLCLLVRPLALGVGRRLVKLLRARDRVGLVEVPVVDLDQLPARVGVLDIGLADGRQEPRRVLAELSSRRNGQEEGGGSVSIALAWAELAGVTGRET